jgi:pimeloyl-ACP methyl ester carboxylesterase
MRTQREFELERLPVDPEKAALGVGPECSRMELDGVSLAWEEAGEGVPVICLHAAGHGSRDFNLLREAAPTGCRLLMLDWPGHGRSGADARSFTVERCVVLLAEFLNVQGWRSAVLLGAEFGAAVALNFAIQHPARVRGLILCQPAGLSPSVAQKPASSAGRALRRRARGVFSKPLDTQAELEQELVESLAMKHALLSNQAALSVLALEDSLRMGLAQGVCPALIVLAARSRTCPAGPLCRFLEPLLSVTPLEQPGLPKLAVFPGRYSPLWEDPARFAQMLSGFVTATTPLDGHRHAWTLAAADWPARGMNQWLCTHPGCYASQALPVEENPNRRTY